MVHTENTMNQILIVEDDMALSRGITLALKSDELTFKQAYNCIEARIIRKGELFTYYIGCESTRWEWF